ncbi:MAG: monovalent cation/H+ antiporter complex subunit F [bacterium]
MEQVYVYIAVLLTVIIAIPFYRVVAGPTIFDRLLGVGAIGTKTLVLICLVGLMFGRLDMFIDITVAYAILNFIGNLAIAKYFVHPKETGEAEEVVS